VTGSARLLAALVAVLGAFLVQVTVLPQLTWHGVAPHLLLLTVVGAALATDTRFATLLGFGAGLLLDVAPPGDHTAGRWALALLVVGYVVGRLSHDHRPVVAGPLDAEQLRRLRRPPWHLVLASAAGGSFVGTSVFALSGLALGEADGIDGALTLLLTTLLLDAVAGLVVVPATVWWFTRRIEPQSPAVVPEWLRRRTPVR
jgi:hypothetical protein